MKKIVLCLLLPLLFFSPAFTQQYFTRSTNVSVDNLKDEITLSNIIITTDSTFKNEDEEIILIEKLVITQTSTIEEVIKVLGQPQHIEKQKGTGEVYAYDQAGVAFNVDDTKAILRVIVTYKPDEKLQPAARPFAGELYIDSCAITDTTSGATISEKTKIGTLLCVDKTCASQPRNKGLKWVVYYVNDKKEIGHVNIILFSKDPVKKRGRSA
jgi:hypothetical protein